ncbi:zinc-ribbon domain-containing protein [Novosphingobium piscinae]|uniref:Zinc-ribbon domain-containing protein n=2 Tax=Novosphingobium piscinae TaxID=1507448 RepID=A0A7X1FXX2_9SPHN|nr:MJ0042-type zinc finger domain-containing protein [Novosphingobium piscinae]MBC2669034.1 zinc-ribbon domain-containing protein [Novosphingobium piscinae]
MIIACPACATRYVVPDSAIGIDGRTVRCAKCRHSWFQSGPDIELPAAPAPVPPAPAVVADDSPMPPPAAPRAAEPAPPPAAAPIDPPPVTAAAPREPVAAPFYDDDESAYSGSTFAHEPPFRPRRNPLKLYTLGAAAFAVIALTAIGAVAWYGLPDWAPLARQTFAGPQPDLALDFPHNRMDRRTLPNGTEFFGISGKVTNVGTQRRTVPTIRIVLRDKQNRIVYQFDVAPPKRQLAPGESVTINEARTDVPRTADAVEYGWMPG